MKLEAREVGKRSKIGSKPVRRATIDSDKHGDTGANLQDNTGANLQDHEQGVKCNDAQAWLFRKLNLTITSGEIVGLQGASGSGKSTLCRMLAGMEPMDEGEILLSGQEVQTYIAHQKGYRSVQTQAARQKGYQPVQLIFQHPEQAVNSRWKVSQILQEGWTPDQELLHNLQIEPEWLRRFPAELSGGQLQRICIARALSPKTKFLLADEMTAMLDAITQAQIWRSMLDIVQSRKLGMLVVSHDRHLLERVCSRIVEM